MAQGTRRRLLMAAATGFGIALCTGLAGCQNTDKTKDKAAAKPAPGLYGTPTLNNTGTAARTAPNYGTQPGSNSTIQQTGGPQVPGQGLGAGQPSFSQTQFGSSNGNNTLNTPALPQNYNSMPNSMSPIGAPARPGTFNSTGGPVGLGSPPSTTTSLSGSLTANSPPVPQLTGVQLAPPMPPGSSLASGAAPIAPPTPNPAAAMPTIPSSIAPSTGPTAFSSSGVAPFSP